MLFMTSSADWIVGRLKRAWFGNSFSERAAKRKDTTRSRVGDAESEQLLLSMIDAVPVGMALLALDGSVLKVNGSLCELLGYLPSEIFRLGLQGITHPDSSNTTIQFGRLASGALESNQFENLYLHRSGHAVWGLSSLSLVRNGQGEPQYFTIQIQDIGKYKRDEDLLRQSQSLLQGIVEGTPDIVFVKDRQGRYLIINLAGARLIGKSTEEILGRDDTELLTSEEAYRANEIDHQVMKSGETREYELTLTIDGVTRALLFTKTPYRGETGEILGLLGIARDITEHQRAAEHLENSRAELRALSAQIQSVREEERMRIAREIHDELGQVLTGLKLDVVSLTKRIPEAQTDADWQQLKERTQSIADLINSAILTVRRISTELRPGLLDAVGLTAAIEWQAKEFEKRTGIKCNLKYPQEDISIDQKRSVAVFRIFQEILTNVTRHAEASEVNIVLEDRETGLFLEAKDNGRGIKASEFSNPKSLGLLGMRERALLLGGEFNIRGSQGKGTTVTVCIPIESEDAR